MKAEDTLDACVDHCRSLTVNTEGRHPSPAQSIGSGGILWDTAALMNRKRQDLQSSYRRSWIFLVPQQYQKLQWRAPTITSRNPHPASQYQPPLARRRLI